MFIYEILKDNGDYPISQEFSIQLKYQNKLQGNLKLDEDYKTV